MYLYLWPFIDITDNRQKIPSESCGSILENGSLFELISATHENSEHSFSKFLFDHINLALTKGFDDNVGRYPVPAYFEVFHYLWIFHYKFNNILVLILISGIIYVINGSQYLYIMN